MLVQFDHAPASEGIRELIWEHGTAVQHETRASVLLYVHSMKWVLLTCTLHMPPTTISIRLANEFTLGYSKLPLSDPALDLRIEVVRTSEGELCLIENRIFSPPLN
jgi:hypothetical protein